jgi:uncharacterized protein (DUF433 family)
MPATPKLDIYKGGNPADLPLYSISEAAHYLRLPAATVRAWAVGRAYYTSSGPRHFPPVIAVADPDPLMLSFHNLVELHVLSSIRRKHEVELKAVRRAIRYLKRHFQSKHPLLDQEMLTDGKDLFIEQYGEFVAISQDRQMAMRRVMEMYLERIDRDSHGVPIRLYPVTRTRVERSPRFVAIDPHIRFGKPCIAGTRIPTAIIAERYEAGDSVALLVEDYGRSTEEIEEVVRYEGRVAS